MAYDNMPSEQDLRSLDQKTFEMLLKSLRNNCADRFIILPANQRRKLLKTANTLARERLRICLVETT